MSGQSFRLAARRPDRSRQAAYVHFQRPPVSRLRRRYARLRAARQRRAPRRAQFQVSPSARHRHRGSGGTERAGARRAAVRKCCPTCRPPMVELYEGLEAASINCWPSVEFDCGALANRVFARAARGVLLQDLHVAAGRVACGTKNSSAMRRGLDARRRRRTPTATRSASIIATCWWSAADPPASRRHSRRVLPVRACCSSKIGLKSATSCVTAAVVSAARRPARGGGWRAPSSPRCRKCAF